MRQVNTPLYIVKQAPATGDSPGASANHWVPNTDAYVTEDGLVIKVELAGVLREDLDLVVEGNRLKISGQRPDGCRASKCKFLIMEINYGPFACVIEVPSGYDLSEAVAAYQNGFLRIDIPKALTGSKRLMVPGSEPR